MIKYRALPLEVRCRGPSMTGNEMWAVLTSESREALCFDSPGSLWPGLWYSDGDWEVPQLLSPQASSTGPTAACIPRSPRPASLANHDSRFSESLSQKNKEEGMERCSRLKSTGLFFQRIQVQCPAPTSLAQNHLWLLLQGTQYPLLDSAGTYTHMDIPWTCTHTGNFFKKKLLKFQRKAKIESNREGNVWSTHRYAYIHTTHITHFHILKHKHSGRDHWYSLGPTVNNSVLETWKLGKR